MNIDNFFTQTEQPPNLKDDKLEDILINQLFIEGIIGNEERFDKLLSKINPVQSFSLKPNYYAEGNKEITIGEDSHDYGSVLEGALVHLDVKYINKIISSIKNKKEEAVKSFYEINRLISITTKCIQRGLKEPFNSLIEDKLINVKDIDYVLYWYAYKDIKNHVPPFINKDLDYTCSILNKVYEESRVKTHGLHIVVEDILKDIETYSKEDKQILREKLVPILLNAKTIGNLNERNVGQYIVTLLEHSVCESYNLYDSKEYKTPDGRTFYLYEYSSEQGKRIDELMKFTPDFIEKIYIKKLDNLSKRLPQASDTTSKKTKI